MIFDDETRVYMNININDMGECTDTNRSFYFKKKKFVFFVIFMKPIFLIQPIDHFYWVELLKQLPVVHKLELDEQVLLVNQFVPFLFDNASCSN